MKRYSFSAAAVPAYEYCEEAEGEWVRFADHCLEMQRLQDVAMELKRQMAKRQWTDFSVSPPESPGHYLVIWHSSPSINYPRICSQFEVMYWAGGKWWAPVNEQQPVTHWMPLPASPSEAKGDTPK